MNSLELKVPDYYLKMDLETIKQYYKLAKVNQEDKYRKAVNAYIESGLKKTMKACMSLSAKEFFPKTALVMPKTKSGSFDETKKASYSCLLDDQTSTVPRVYKNHS